MDPASGHPTLIGGPSPAGRNLAARLLTQSPDDLPLGMGEIVLLTATADPRPRWSWTLPLDVLVTTARLAPALAGRTVRLVSPLTQDPIGPGAAAALDDWLTRLRYAAAAPCPPWRVAGLCRDFLTLAEPLISAADGGDPCSGLARLTHQVQRLLVEQAAGRGAVRTVAGIALAAAADPLRIDPPIPVVVPPRLARPDVVADRQQEAIWTGMVKHGNRWSGELASQLRQALALAPGDQLLVTRSGTDALRLAIAATTGRARPGDVAVLPSFTFRATADVLLQLGYELRYADVDPWSWTLDPSALQHTLADERVRLVLCVDTFGNPCAYEPLRALCRERGVPLIADSAASLGSTVRGTPVGTQASAHAFSMSFAKVLTSAGAGGALVLPAGSQRHDLRAWLGSALMDELHAIAALDQLALLPDLVARRNQVAQAYQEVADELPGVVTQGCATGTLHSYVHWVAQFPHRDRLARELDALGVQTKPYFSAQHLHHETHRHAPCPAVLPVTERLDREALALPASSELSHRQIARLAVAFAQAAARAGLTAQDADPCAAFEEAR